MESLEARPVPAPALLFRSGGSASGTGRVRALGGQALSSLQAAAEGLSSGRPLHDGAPIAQRMGCDPRSDCASPAVRVPLSGLRAERDPDQSGGATGLVLHAAPDRTDGARVYCTLRILARFLYGRVSAQLRVFVSCADALDRREVRVRGADHESAAGAGCGGVHELECGAALSQLHPGLVNGLRMYGAVLSTWSGVMGLVAAIMDDPKNKITYEVWSVGAMGLSGASLASLLLFHTEDFWFRLGLLASSKPPSSDANELWKPEDSPDALDMDTSGGKAGMRSLFSKFTPRFQARSRATALKQMCVRNGAASVDSQTPPLTSVPSTTQQQQQQEREEPKEATCVVRVGTKKLSMLRRARSPKRNTSPNAAAHVKTP